MYNYRKVIICLRKLLNVMQIRNFCQSVCVSDMHCGYQDHWYSFLCQFKCGVTLKKTKRSIQTPASTSPAFATPLNIGRNSSFCISTARCHDTLPPFYSFCIFVLFAPATAPDMSHPLILLPNQLRRGSR